MFYPEFTKCDYEEHQMDAVLVLESFMRIAARQSPAIFGPPSKHEMTERLEEALTLLGLPPGVVDLADAQTLVRHFIDNEYESIRALAEDSLNRFPDCGAAMRDFCVNPLPLPTNLPKGSREAIVSGRVASWLKDAEMGMREKRRERDEGEDAPEGGI